MAFTESDIAKVDNWQSLVRVAHGMALEKGWWDGGIAARPIEDIINNFHAEVSEAWEEYRSKRMETWYSDPNAVLEGRLPKPEGFFVELADLLIRIADAACAHRIEFPSHYEPIEPRVFRCASRSIFFIHKSIANCGLTFAVDECFGFSKVSNHDLWATIREKLTYNATRPHRHGGKLA